MINKLFSKYSKTKKYLSKELLYDFYAQVSAHIKSGNIDEGVWAKAFADAKGNEQEAKAIYLDLMVEKMILAHESSLEIEHKKQKEQKERLVFEKQEEKKLKREMQKNERAIELQRKRAKEKKAKDKTIKVIRIPASLLLIWGGVWISLESYESIESLESFVFIPLVLFASWYWWWYDVE